MELENKNNKILDDLDKRNKNWEKLDGIPEKVTDLDTTVSELDENLKKVSRVIGLDTARISNWKQVQDIVRSGQARDYFEIGDQFTATYNGIPYVWDVIGINHDKPSDPKFEYSLTLQSRDVLLNAVLSAAQAMAYVSVELQPGDQYVTFDNKQFKFTNNVKIEVGSVLVGGGWTGYVPSNITIYKADRVTVVQANVPMTQVTGQTDTITDVNDRIRSRYGSNNYVESGIRQWLNSNESDFKWKSKTKFDMPSSYATGGFLKLLDQDLANVIGEVDKQVARNTVTDGGGQDVFSDKVFLLSRKEVYGGDEGTVTGENPYEYYAVMSGAPTTAAVDWRVKYLDKVARHWWLSSPYVGNSYHARFVGTTGSVSYSGANDALGVAPACVII